MFRKLLRRIAILWCLYGLVKVCIFVNPWLFCVAKMIKPYEPWDSTSAFQISLVWAVVLFALGIAGIICCVIHYLSEWFFGETEEYTEE